MKKLSILLGFLMLLGIHSADAEQAAPLQTLARMPVKEITVFKDGHAFVLHQGKMPTDESGNVVLDYLPTPVIGTFWPFSAEEQAKLSAVTASRKKVLVERTALTLRELIEANVGAQAIITERPIASITPTSYPATILGVPTQSGEELEAVSPPHSGEYLARKGEVVLLQTDDGAKVVGFDRILDIMFPEPYQKMLAHEEFRNLLTLKLDWQDGQPQPDADVGLVYVQKGIRWIPSYKVTINGEGSATVQLQATLINELADLEDVTAYLVIGVPTFAFKDTLDPIALQETVAQLSQHFQPDAQTAHAFSNVLMTQVAAAPPPQASVTTESRSAMDLGPEVAESGKNEDLFMFRVEHVTLKKGQRMVMSITQMTLDYRDVYSLEIPFTPPPEVWRTFSNVPQAEMAQLLHAPKVMHKIRLSNKSEYPLTTAPALIVRDNRVLAQGMMTYTPVGSDCDLDITTAVDIQVKKSDTETQRTPNAVQWHGDQYGRIDLEGTITLTNFKPEPVEVEVVRHVLGNIDEVGQDGKSEMVNIFEDPTYAEPGGRPYWWGWFAWPYWWYHFNSVGRITWNVTLEPEQPVELHYTWYYYWR